MSNQRCTPREKKRKPTMAKHLRHIADTLASAGMLNFPTYLRAAAREVSELRWENGLLRRKLNMKARVHHDKP